MIDLSKIPHLIKNDLADAISINNIEIQMGITLPTVYKHLLKCSNGFSIGGGLTIYGTEDIVERNLTWEVEEYAKGYIAIGDDGGGNVFLMLKKEESTDVLVVDSGDMNPLNAIKVTSDFTKWISSGCINETLNTCIISNLPPDFCDIVLQKSSIGGAKDLLKIKTIIGFDMSIGELLKGSKNLPFVLASNFPYGKAIKLVKKLGDLSSIIKLVAIDKDNN